MTTKKDERVTYKVGQIVKVKKQYYPDQNVTGMVVATRIDNPDSYLVTWYEAHEAWTKTSDIIEVCPIETLKAAKNNPEVEELLNDCKTS